MNKFVIISLFAALMFISTNVFAEEEVEKPSWMDFKGFSKEEPKALSFSVLKNEEIIRIGKTLAAESLSFSSTKYMDDLENVKKYYSEKGWNSYMAFLNEFGALDIIREKNYSLTTIPSGDVRINKKGVAGGVYKWILFIPLLGSYADQSTPPEVVSNFNAMIFMQLARTYDTKNDYKVVIERFGFVKTKK